MITHTELKKRLRYDPASGIFTWISGGRFGCLSGKVAGCKDDDGYVRIGIDGVLYRAHRLAWLYMTGTWPPSGFIDHKNATPGDDRWENLRDATERINQENRHRAGKNNKTGLLGVSPNGKRFKATINTNENGKRRHHYLGTFDTPQQAHDAYIIAKRQMHKGCTI